MAMRLTLRQPTKVPLDVAHVLPETTRDRSAREIGDLPILAGNRRLRLADCFDIACDDGTEGLVWDGNLRNVHSLGAGMSEGTLRILGNAGDHVGAGMRGGRLEVQGHVGDWAGAEMVSGVLDVRGGAGDGVGAAYRGSRRGMRGGTILVHGNAGSEIGHAMRRGLIAIGGDCGDLVGHNLIAGTIVLGGGCGPQLGLGMRRGTIVSLRGETHPGPTFVYACTHRPLIFRLLHATLRKLGFPCPAGLVDTRFELYHGDFAEGGRGELLQASAGVEKPAVCSTQSSL